MPLGAVGESVATVSRAILRLVLDYLSLRLRRPFGAWHRRPWNQRCRAARVLASLAPFSPSRQLARGGQGSAAELSDASGPGDCRVAGRLPAEHGWHRLYRGRADLSCGELAVVR
jgi:hypothetical protein